MKTNILNKIWVNTQNKSKKREHVDENSEKSSGKEIVENQENLKVIMNHVVH